MKTELQSTNFKVLLEGFQRRLETSEKSKSAIKNYPKGMKEFFLYLENHFDIRHISKVEKKHCVQFIQYLQNRKNFNTENCGISNQTINGTINAINSFNKYVSKDDHTSKYNITADRLPVTTAERIVLSQKETIDLYNASFEPYPHKPSSKEFGQRDRVILALLYGSGLRLNEARNVDLNDIDFPNKRVLVNGKGGKQRRVPIANQFLEDIKAYIQQGRYYFTERHHQQYCRVKTVRKVRYQKDESALLLGIEGTRLLSFTTRLNYLKGKANIQKNLSPHILRHSLGSHLYQSGLDLDEIRKIFGHVSIDTTQIYIHLSNQLKNESDQEII